MSDIAQVLAAGGTTIVGVVVGAGLTHWLNTLNRRHQEAREKDTRWYQTRFNAFVELSRAVFDGELAKESHESPLGDREAFFRRTTGALGAILLVASPEASEAAGNLFSEIVQWIEGAEGYDKARLGDALTEFRAVARKDLGHEG